MKRECSIGGKYWTKLGGERSGQECIMYCIIEDRVSKTSETEKSGEENKENEINRE